VTRTWCGGWGSGPRPHREGRIVGALHVGRRPQLALAVVPVSSSLRACHACCSFSAGTRRELLSFTEQAMIHVDDGAAEGRLRGPTTNRVRHKPRRDASGKEALKSLQRAFFFPLAKTIKNLPGPAHCAATGVLYGCPCSVCCHMIEPRCSTASRALPSCRTCRLQEGGMRSSSNTQRPRSSIT
jgi:hypothetical protein